MRVCKTSFQVLGKLYAVLSDKEQRVVYDEQGVVDEESDVLSQDRCWEEYWRLLFPKVLTCWRPGCENTGCTQILYAQLHLHTKLKNVWQECLLHMHTPWCEMETDMEAAHFAQCDDLCSYLTVDPNNCILCWCDFKRFKNCPDDEICAGCSEIKMYSLWRLWRLDYHLLSCHVLDHSAGHSWVREEI